MPQQLNRVAPLLEQMSQHPLAISQTAAGLFQQSIEYVVSDAKAMATAFATTKEAKAAKLAQALAYQASLTKSGVPSKKAAA